MCYSSQVSHIFDGMAMLHSNRIHHAENKTSGAISRRLVQTKCLQKNLDEKRLAVMGAWDYPIEWGMFDRLAALSANVCGKEHSARDEQHRCFSVHTLENVCGKKHLWELNVVGRSTLLGMTYTGCFSVHTLKNVCGNRMFSNGFQNNLFPPEIW